MKSLRDLLEILKKYEIIFASAIVVIAVILSSFSLLIPNFQKVNKILWQENNLKTRFSNLQKKEARLTTIEENYYKKAYSRLLTVLPMSKDYVSLFTTFDQLQTKSGVVIANTSFQLGVVSTTSAILQKAARNGAYIIPMTVDIYGSIEQAKIFIKSLMSLEGRLISLDEINWTYESDDFIKATLKGNAFFYPQPPIIPDVDLPLTEYSSRSAQILSKLDQIQPDESQIEEIDRVSLGKKSLFE